MSASLSKQDATPFLCVTFCPTERLATAVLRLVASFCSMTNVSSRFYMAAHELAENITKYSVGPCVSLELALEEGDSACIMKIRARNQASPERLREVERRFAELGAAIDPVKHYDHLICSTAMLEGVSGLGLARIRAEGGLDLEYSIEGSELTIVASGPISGSWSGNEQLRR